MTEEQLILVDENDRELGSMPKLEVHRKALLHRAFSLLIFNQNGEMLIHQRALNKYHSPGLWTNACCSHPNWGEDTESAAHRRLQQEMGFDCPLDFQFKFRYITELEGGLTEHELDHVYVGIYDQNPIPNAEEVANYRWISEDQLKAEMKLKPDQFTFWFKEIMLKYAENITFPAPKN